MPAYRAPQADKAILADPPRDEWPRLAEENRRRLNAADVIVGGMPLRELRQLARSDIVPSRSGPLLLSGHQPELSHPGVWVKNFALNGLARQLGGTPLNLIVDNDTLKSAALRVPTWEGRNPGTVRLQSVPFDTAGGERPYESRRVHDADLFRTFADRVAPLWRNWGFEPLLPRAWACINGYQSDNIGEKFAAARRCYEGEWGCRNSELPVSEFGSDESWWYFVLHIVNDLPRFHDTYNSAIRRYRRANGIRSRNHPVPELVRDGDWYESPFWVNFPSHIKDGSGRARLSVARNNDIAYWMQGQNDEYWSMPTSTKELDDDEFAPLTMHNVVVRPRALTLTLFARLCLGDFFIHGIGGGKYDEVTDSIIRDYFGIEPPRFGVLSATLNLPVPTFRHTFEDVRGLERHERDLTWNPQRYANGHDDWKAEKARLIATEPTGRGARRRWFRDLKDVTGRLRSAVAEQLRETEDNLALAEQEAAANAKLSRRRDFSWALYPEEALRPFLQSFL